MGVDGFGGLQYDSGFIPPPTTNNRAELYSQIAALQDLHTDYGPCEIEIVSDSAYAVMGASDPARKRNANTDLWQSLDAITRLHTHVQWRHVRGHCSTKWNMLADTLAVKAKKEATWST